MKWIKKHKKLCIGLGVVLLLVVVGVLQSKGKKEETVKEEVATVERRTLMKSVSATGTFIAADSEKYTSETVGVKVASVNVEVGDKVAVGDILCVLDTTDLSKQLEEAKESVADSNQQAQNTKESAAKNLETAQLDRQDGIQQIDDNIAEAKKEWEDAESTYGISLESYNTAVADFNGITDTTSDAYFSAKAQMNTMRRQMEADRKTADNRKQNYDSLVANRATNVQRVEDAYQRQVEVYEDTIERADDGGSMQQDRVEQLQEQIQNAVIKATVSGLVTAVNVEPGDRYNGQVIAVVENVDSFDVTTEIGEYDINQVAEGQEVVIKTNATGEEELEGVVKKVSPIATGSTSSDLTGGLGFDVESMLGQGISAGTKSSQDVNFTVVIAVKTPCDKLRIGMTAKLNIVIQKNEDVLSVPYNAVQTAQDDSFFVQQITGKDEEGNYKTKKVPVYKGIESDYYTELVDSGLKEGTKILLPKTENGNSIEEMLSNSSSMGGI